LADQHVVPAWPTNKGDESVYHIYVVRVKDRDARLAWLNSQGIGAGIHYPFPIHRLRAYQAMGQVCGSVAEAEGWANECLSLPLYPELTAEQRQQVVTVFRQYSRKQAA
jgi:dTDP-4-amino-4,6-dideoxygalactose transaminase